MASPVKKLVAVGDTHCGKKTLLSALLNTIVTYKVDGNIVPFTLWSTAGQDENEIMRYKTYLNADVVLMCFSIASPESFANIEKKWLPEVRSICPKVPIVLVGNMKDLRFIEDADFNLPNKLVKMADAYTKGVKINAFGYTEVSAQYNVGVLELLKSAIQATSEKDNKYLSSMV